MTDEMVNEQDVARRSSGSSSRSRRSSKIKRKKQSPIKAKLRQVMKTDAPEAVILIRLIVGATFLSEGIQEFLVNDAEIARMKTLGMPQPESLGALAGYLEILCGALILAGLLTRIAAVPLLMIIVVAFANVQLDAWDELGLWEMAHAMRNDWAMTLGSAFLLWVGAGKWSLDEVFAQKLKPRIRKGPDLEKGVYAED